ncbi:hypothetical protein BDV36DRAFT_298406 [Aspergillus pseudocaelatus]|uniref:Uncharacterized protein n=1 Tax=Aspergillus pseudocaelatus TaxID=1825620 RepID=A0ABQ6WDB7_9EURO|nr:hypothetical protein BDV36DRAFT_298406 [Aspergillus pseudocaelatus]
MGYMNQPKFMELYTYALESDFQSPDGEPAAWDPGHPFRWDELRQVFFAPSRIECKLYTLVSSAEGSIVVWELDRDGKNVSAEKNENRVDIGTLSAKAADTAISKLVANHGWKLGGAGTKAITEGFKTTITRAVDIHALKNQITLDGKLAFVWRTF